MPARRISNFAIDMLAPAHLQALEASTQLLTKLLFSETIPVQLLHALISKRTNHHFYEYDIRALSSAERIIDSKTYSTASLPERVPSFAKKWSDPRVKRAASNLPERSFSLISESTKIAPSTSPIEQVAPSCLLLFIKLMDLCCVASVSETACFGLLCCIGFRCTLECAALQVPSWTWSSLRSPELFPKFYEQAGFRADVDVAACDRPLTCSIARIAPKQRCCRALAMCWQNHGNKRAPTLFVRDRHEHGVERLSLQPGVPAAHISVCTKYLRALRGQGHDCTTYPQQNCF